MPISVSVTGTGAYTTPPGKPQPGQTYAPPPTPTYIAAITYDGTNITPLVIYEDAEFISNVNGTPGSCRFRIRDFDRSLSFTVGRPITLAINGVTEWTGFVSKIFRETAFPDGPAAQPRIFTIEGVDINILFRKRYTFLKSNPKDVTGKTYKYAGTPVKDTTAISALVSGYLDLSGDGIDTSTLVTNVGDINVDQDASPIGIGWTWEQAMAAINRLPAAVYYITPEKKLVWGDVDVADAPWSLSDTPDGSTSYGYREAAITYDGSRLANEYFAWGAGAGSANMVFKTLRSDSSVAAHGLWQDMAFVTDVYKQGTIDKICSSYVNGSPGSKRGHKDDRVSVTCTTFRQGLRAGMRVTFTCGAHGYTDILPVRQLRITFPTPVNPRYDLTLSHEIDVPLGYFDPWNPKWTTPRWAPVGWYSGVTCWYDLFDRTTGNSSGITSTSWGQATSGYGSSAYYWTTLASSGGKAWVDGEGGHLLIADGGTFFETSYTTAFLYTTQTSGTESLFAVPVDIRFDLDWRNIGSGGALYFRGLDPANPSASNGYIWIQPSSSPIQNVIEIGAPYGGSPWDRIYLGPNNGGNWAGYAPDVAQRLQVHFRIASDFVNVWVWPYGTAEPVSPTLSLTIANTNALVGNVLPTFSVDGTYNQNNADFQAIIDNLSICPMAPVVTNVVVDPGEIWATYNGNGTTTLPFAVTFFKGTTRVWKNGVMQRLNVDYTENPHIGTLTLSTAASASDIFTVFFHAATNTMGGPVRRML